MSFRRLGFGSLGGVSFVAPVLVAVVFVFAEAKAAAAAVAL